MTKSKRRPITHIFGRRIQRMVMRACLVAQKDSSLLLIKSRTQPLWYFPSTKIRKDEVPEQVLYKMLKEELGILMSITSLGYLTTIIDPFYEGRYKVMLICFSIDIPESWHSYTKIAELAWINKDQLELMAPSVQSLIEKVF